LPGLLDQKTLLSDVERTKKKIEENLYKILTLETFYERSSTECSTIIIQRVKKDNIDAKCKKKSTRRNSFLIIILDLL
jgi:hypothetical protein